MSDSAHSRDQLLAELDAAQRRIIALEAKLAGTRRIESEVAGDLAPDASTAVDQGELERRVAERTAELQDEVKRLRRREKDFHNLLNNGWDDYSELDRDLRFRYFSPTFYTHSGLRPEDVLGKTRLELADKDDLARNPEKWAKHREDLEHHRPYRNFEYTIRNSTGRTLYFRTSAIPIFDELGNFEGYRGTGTNLTELKEIELALRESEAKLRDIAENASDWFWETDAEHRFTALTGRFKELTHQDPKTRLGMTRLEMAPEDIARYPKKWAQHRDDLDHHRPFRNFQYGVTSPDGEWRYVRTSGSPVFDDQGEFIGYRGTASDITHEKMAELALRESESRLRDVLDTASDWFWETDEKQRFVFRGGSDKFYKATGVRLEDVIGKTRLDIVPEEIRARHPEKWQRHWHDVLNQRPFRNFIYGIPNKQGETTYYRISGTPYYDERGNFKGYRGSGSNITKQVQIEKELKHARDELELRVEERTRDLRDSQARYTSVYQSSPNAISIIRLDTGVLIDVNKGFERVTGIEHAEAVGNTELGLGLWLNPKARRALITRLEQTGTVQDYPMVLKRRDGRLRHCAISASVVDLQEQPHAVFILRDDTERVDAIATLRESEERLREILDNTPAVVFMKDVQGRYLTVNHRFEELFDISRELLTEKTDYDLLPQEVADKLRENDRQVIARRQPIEFEERVPHQGEMRNYLSVKFPLFDERGDPYAICGISTDTTDRKRMALANERLAAAIETLSEPLALYDENDRFVMCNERFRELNAALPETLVPGVPFAELIRATVRKGLIPQAAGREEEWISERLQRHRNPSGPFELQRQDGLILMTYEQRLADGATVMLYTDITEIKRTEEALLNSNRMLQLVLDTIPVRVFWKDRQLNYLGCNQTFANDAGRASPEELIGKSDWEMAWEDQAELYRTDDMAVIESRRAKVNYEEPQTTPDGKTIWLQTSKVPIVDEQGSVLGVLGTYADITPRKHAEEELHKLQNYLHNIVNSMPSMLVGVDAEGQITQWNREAERVTGVDADTALGQPLDHIYPALRSEMERVRRAIAERKVQRTPKIAQSTSPDTVYQEVTVYPLVTNGVEGAVIRIDDVTERVRLEQMMIQSEKMLSVGGLAAGMAHEINNPLAGILQNTQVLRNRLSPELAKNVTAAEQCGTSMENINEYMEKRDLPRMIAAILDSGQRAARIVENMLSFARKSTSRFVPHDLAALLDRTLELAESDYDLKKRYDFRQIEIVREYDPDLEPVRCEGGMMQQVFLNLLRNGAEAMGEYCPKAGRRPRFTLRTQRLDDAAVVEVEDNGSGMDDFTRRRVFEPFFTTKEVGSGTGLGLSVSYFIVTENHHGSMRVESTPEHGSRFRIELPLEGEA